LDDGEMRRLAHLTEAKRGNRSHKNNWVRSVQKAGGEIVSTVLESGMSWDESASMEIFHIAHHRSLGCNLTNMTDGGDGTVGCTKSVETRAKISASRKGKRLSDEVYARQAATRTGKKRKPFSVEWRANIGASFRGKPLSAEHRTKISNGLKGKRKGIPFTAEHRANLSAAQKGVRHAAERNAKTSATMLARNKIIREQQRGENNDVAC